MLQQGMTPTPTPEEAQLILHLPRHFFPFRQPIYPLPTRMCSAYWLASSGVTRHISFKSIGLKSTSVPLYLPFSPNQAFPGGFYLVRGSLPGPPHFGRHSSPPSHCVCCTPPSKPPVSGEWAEALDQEPDLFGGGWMIPTQSLEGIS